MKIELITLTGLILTFIVGVANIIISIKNNKRSTFINSVTASRIEYIQNLRNAISEFCAAAASKNNKENLTLKNEDYIRFEMEANKLKYLIWLYLNPEDKYWDDEIIKLINDISKMYLSDLKDIGDLKQKTEKLIVLTQYLLKLEWEGAKIESKRGIISDIEKKELYNKYVGLHQKYVEENLNKFPREVKV